MSKRVITLTIIVYTIASLLIVGMKLVSAEESQRVIFYIPHQDDEILSMGPSIINHLNTGQEVHLVLYTDGAGSRIKGDMNSRDFQQARNKEFILSALSLGVDPNNLHFENLQDGSVTKNQIRMIITKYDKLYPNAKHKTMTYHDPHNDHRAGGEALLDLYNEGLIVDARFYVFHEKYDTSGFQEYITNDASLNRLKMSISSYNIDNPEAGLYRIGFRSVGKSVFDNLINEPKSVIHKPNR